MNEKTDTRVKVRFLKPCPQPEVGGLLPIYAADLLADDAAEALEEHLLRCAHCRADYQKIMRLRATAQALAAAATTTAETGPHAERSADVLRLSDRKK